MYLSPCLIAIVVIITYILIGRQNQIKIKNYINQNQTIFISIIVIGSILFFTEGTNLSNNTYEDSEIPPKCGK